MCGHRAFVRRWLLEWERRYASRISNTTPHLSMFTTAGSGELRTVGYTAAMTQSQNQTARRLLRGVSRDTRDVVLAAVDRGWTVKLTAKGHVQLRHPSGAILYCSGSTSDRRSHHYVQADIAHVERAQANEQ